MKGKWAKQLGSFFIACHFHYLSLNIGKTVIRNESPKAMKREEKNKGAR